MSLLRIHTLVIGAWFIVALVVVTMSVVLGVPGTATLSAGWLALGAMLSVSVMQMLRVMPTGTLAPVVTRRQHLSTAPRNRR